MARGDAALLRRLFDAAHDAIVLLDMDADRVRLANPRAVRMLGYGPLEILQRAASDLIPGDMSRLRTLLETLARPGAGWTDEFVCVHATGVRFPVEVSASLLLVDGSRCLLAHMRDISLRKSTDDRFRSAYQRMQADVQSAARIQKLLLPKGSPVVPGMRFAWELFPSGELAGDTLNLFRLDDGHVGLFVLDVSGHGAPAAMMSMAIHRLMSPTPAPPSVLFRLRPDGSRSSPADPEEVCRDLNSHFQMDPDFPQYFTVLYGLLETGTGRMRYVSAGHCPPVYVPPGGEPVVLEGTSPPIGFFRDSGYEARSVTLEPGSRLYMHSDGLTEAFNGEGEPFGTGRLMRAIAEVCREPLGESLTSLLGAMRTWSRDGNLADDVSLLACEVAPGRREDGPPSAPPATIR